jgi:hypothetical protein
MEGFVVEVVLRAALSAAVDPGIAEPLLQFAGAAHEIGVNVRFKDVCDLKVQVPRERYVAIAVRHRIHDSGNAFGVVPKEVGELGNTGSKKLLEVYSQRMFLFLVG